LPLLPHVVLGSTKAQYPGVAVAVSAAMTLRGVRAQERST
jgi:hypothetical protein